MALLGELIDRKASSQEFAVTPIVRETLQEIIRVAAGDHDSVSGAREFAVSLGRIAGAIGDVGGALGSCLDVDM
jgi:hypothetical protein